jgi:hypothetical protein
MEESSSGSGGHSRHTATHQLPPPAPTTSSMTEDDKRSMASMIQRECSSFGTSWQLDALLDEVLAPDKPIDNFDDIDWCKWIIAGGRDPLEFASIGECQTIILLIQSFSRLCHRRVRNSKGNSFAFLVSSHSNKFNGLDNVDDN